jgi:hypothetical protein
VATVELPLFPLHTVLFPGGLLPLRVFEQRYLEMAKSCLRDGTPFVVCLILRGPEVAGADRQAIPQFAPLGTSCRIVEWDMPQQGILHLVARGEQRHHIAGHRTRADGLVLGAVEAIPPEPAVPVAAAHRAAVDFLAQVVARVGSKRFAAPARLDDASWVGHRLAELLPLPLPVKQGMLEINDAGVRLALICDVLRRQGLL